MTDNIENSIKPITLIDDEEMAHVLFRMLMKMHRPDLPATAFSDPAEVINLIKQNNFQSSAILLDINMPQMDGWGFLKALETLNYTVPVYMLSSSDHSRDKTRAKEYKNVVDYFVKPLSIEQLRIIFDKYFPPKG